MAEASRGFRIATRVRTANRCPATRPGARFRQPPGGTVRACVWWFDRVWRTIDGRHPIDVSRLPRVERSHLELALRVAQRRSCQGADCLKAICGRRCAVTE